VISINRPCSTFKTSSVIARYSAAPHLRT
jgi:hypothetical protein